MKSEPDLTPTQLKVLEVLRANGGTDKGGVRVNHNSARALSRKGILRYMHPVNFEDANWEVVE